jgi:molybdopterin synthase sulfur carrier subunit
MITVRVKLFGTLRRARPDVPSGQAFSVLLANGATVGDLIDELGLPEEQVKLVFVKGRTRGREYVLTDGDDVGIFPPVGGG